MAGFPIIELNSRVLYVVTLEEGLLRLLKTAQHESDKYILLNPSGDGTLHVMYPNGHTFVFKGVEEEYRFRGLAELYLGPSFGSVAFEFHIDKLG